MKIDPPEPHQDRGENVKYVQRFIFLSISCQPLDNAFLGVSSPFFRVKRLVLVGIDFLAVPPARSEIFPQKPPSVNFRPVFGLNVRSRGCFLQK